MKKRLDQILVDQGLAPSRTKAQELIEQGQITLRRSVGGAPIDSFKSASKFDSGEITAELATENILKYVSRSGFKLEGALLDLGLNLTGVDALDVGQSKGGFTDCLLQKGAARVTGIDVATDELDQKLRADSRVILLAGVNARDLSKVPELAGKKFDLVVVDVSFISLTLVLPELMKFIKSGGHLLALVKPQFEVGSANIGKDGVVKNQKSLEDLKNKMLHFAKELSLIDIQYLQAKIKGRDGNQEYFIYGKAT